MSVKAIGLLSGGLDSTLAAKVLKMQGIEVIGLHLYTGLCITEHKRRVGTTGRDGSVPENPAFRMADNLGIPMDILDISDTYLDIIARPKYGRGQNANPCRDCRIHMMEHAFNYMEEVGAQFIFTGEVLGQRPMSQVKHHMNFIHNRAGDPDLILSPLSAKLMQPTKPEREGWVDREKLYAFEGRSRKPQLALAKELGVDDFESPAGGCCFLTDEAYSRKFMDLLQVDPDRRLDMEDIVLCGVGRHFRFSEHLKVIVGRNANENNVIERHASRHYRYHLADKPGPLTVAIGVPTPEDDKRIAALTARYAMAKGEEPVAVRKVIGEQEQILEVPPADLEQFEALRI